jgi:hypothetical protein
VAQNDSGAIAPPRFSQSLELKEKNLRNITILAFILFCSGMALAEKPFSWEGTYEGGLDGAGVETIVVSKTSEGNYVAEVTQDGRGSSGVTLICDVRFGDGDKEMTLLHKEQYDWKMIDKVFTKVKVDAFTPGEEYTTLTRKIVKGEEIFNYGEYPEYRKKH